jgi:pimeloyl-ACP methyl ester carboxylesterase
VEEWEAAFPDATLGVIDVADHYPQVEQPDQVFDAISLCLRGN